MKQEKKVSKYLDLQGNIGVVGYVKADGTEMESLLLKVYLPKNLIAYHMAQKPKPRDEAS